jgi:hypothetical protein
LVGSGFAGLGCFMNVSSHDTPEAREWRGRMVREQLAARGIRDHRVLPKTLPETFVHFADSAGSPAVPVMANRPMAACGIRKRYKKV